MKGSIKLAVIAVLVVLTGCQKSSPLTGADVNNNPRPLLVAQDGSVVSGDCLKENDISDCTLDVSKQATQTAAAVRSGHRSGSGLRGWRGSYSNWWASVYYTLLIDLGYYQYYNPSTYSNSSFSSYWGFNNNWYSWLGWNNSNTTYSSNNSCSTCVTSYGSTYCQNSCITTINVNTITYAPTPIPSTSTSGSCNGLTGTYYGSCYAGGASSSITVSVAPSGGSCVATSSYFQPVTLNLVGSTATASVSQVVGGVAITGTTLNVSGLGNFSMTGYNYAGNFYFNCHN